MYHECYHGVWKSQKKVSFNIASEASYVYILNGQKLSILTSFRKSEACGQTVLPDRSLIIGQKIVENAKIQKNSNATFWVIFKHCVALYVPCKTCSNKSV